MFTITLAAIECPVSRAYTPREISRPIQTRPPVQTLKQLTGLFVVSIVYFNLSSAWAGQAAPPGSHLEIVVDTATLSSGEYVEIVATLRNDSESSFYVGTGINSRHRGLDFTNFYYTLRLEGTTEWHPRTITFWDRNRATNPDRSTEKQLIARGSIKRVDPKEAYRARITLRLEELASVLVESDKPLGNPVGNIESLRGRTFELQFKYIPGPGPSSPLSIPMLKETPTSNTVTLTIP